MKDLPKSSMLYAAQTLDLRCRMGLINLMMPEKADEVLTSVKAYFIREFPELGATPDTPLPSFSLSPTRPPGMSI